MAMRMLYSFTNASTALTLSWVGAQTIIGKPAFFAYSKRLRSAELLGSVGLKEMIVLDAEPGRAHGFDEFDGFRPVKFAKCIGSDAQLESPRRRLDRCLRGSGRAARVESHLRLGARRPLAPL